MRSLGDGKDLLPLKRLIIDRTEGNPFFMEEIKEALFDQGMLARNGGVKLAKPMTEVRLPPTVQGVLASRIDRLGRNEKELLQTLAVIGQEFPLSLIRKVAGAADDDLERMLSELQVAEFIYEQPAVSDAEYTFKHALTQEVAHGLLLNERRKELHRRIAAAIESLYGERLEDHYGELAHHYSRADERAKAVHYLGLAGEQAFARWAYAEAIAHLATGLDLLKALSESPARDRQELRMQLILASASSVVTGPASNEAAAAFLRAMSSAVEAAKAPISYALWLVLQGCICSEERCIRLTKRHRRLWMPRAGSRTRVSWQQPITRRAWYCFFWLSWHKHARDWNGPSHCSTLRFLSVQGIG